MSDFEAAAQKMADEAISGVNNDAAEAELKAIRQRYPGLHREVEAIMQDLALEPKSS